MFFKHQDMKNRIKIFVLLFFLLANSINAQTYQHLIMYGQSLSNGDQSWPPLSTTPVANNYMIGSQVWINYGNTGTKVLNPLIATVAADANANLPRTTASRILCESSIVNTANSIQLTTGGGNKFIVTSCGTSGRSVEQLSKDYYSPSLYSYFTNTINSAYSITTDISCPALFWMQGEANYNLYPLQFSADDGLLLGGTFTADKDRYKYLMLKLKNNMQNDIKTTYKQADKPTFFIYQTGGSFARGKTLEIGMAQLEASNEYDDIVCAGPIYYLPERGGHLDPNGHRWFGEMWAKAYYKTKVLGEDFRPLQPKQILRTSNPNKIQIKFLVPVLPLVFETNLVPKYTDYGFQVYLNGSSTKVTLSSVVINDDCVELTSTNSLAGDVEVVYAGYGTGIGGKGNLRDSDPYVSTTSYIDLDKKDANGNFVYTHDASITTLHSPIYEPKAVDGTDIYDKPYPLFNFSLAFYYKLNASDQVYNVPNLVPGVAMQNVTDISLSAPELSINVGAKSTLTTTLLPTNSTNLSVLWSSSNPSIASVTKGVVSAIGPGVVTVTATSVDQSKTVNCIVTCNAITQKSFTGLPQSIKGNIEFEDFDIGGEGVAYHDSSAGNIVGTYRPNDNVDIVTCTDTGAGYCVNNTGAGEWMKYTVNVPTAGSYNISVRYASNNNSNVHFEVDGINKTGTLNLPVTYSGTTLLYKTLITTINLNAGNQTLKFVVEDGNSNFNYFNLTPITGINQIESQDSKIFKIFPNPTKDLVNIEFNCDKSQKVNCSILDVTGKEVMQYNIDAVEGINKQKIDITSLSKGSYLFYLQINKGGGISNLLSKIVII